MEIWRLKDDGVTSWTFWGHVTSSVTGHRFDSHGSTSYGWSIVPIVYLALLRRCGASNIGRTEIKMEINTEIKMEEGKEEGKGRERESGREKRWRKGMEGKGKGKENGKGKEKGERNGEGEVR